LDHRILLGIIKINIVDIIIIRAEMSSDQLYLPDAHFPGFWPFLQIIPTELPLALKFELVKEGFRVVIIDQDKRFARIQGFKCLKYERVSFCGAYLTNIDNFTIHPVTSRVEVNLKEKVE
jgi:hypothetical protein